jgi:hypothetical protein
MKNMLIVGLACVTFARPGAADVIFDNSQHDSNIRFNPGFVEVGDEILLAGNARYLTNFTFEYWGTNCAAAGNPLFGGNVQFRIRFYQNDGPMFNGYPSPGTAFWDTGWINMPPPTPRQSLVFTPGLDFPPSGLYLPSSGMTWSVQFRGMSLTDTVGVDFYWPQVTGGEFPDYWENNGGWTLRTNSAGPADFAARMEATLVPAPALPFLTIHRAGAQTVLSWPGWATNFNLESTARVDSGAAWSVVGATSQWIDNNFVLFAPIQSAPAFFRLHAP